jgi:hypothetical protein
VQVVKLEITGVGSLLMHNPASMRKPEQDKLQRGGKKIPEPYDEAKAGLYALPNHQLYLKSDMFREAGLIAAADARDPSRKGRATMTKRFAASVFLCSEHCPLFRANGKANVPITDSDEDWEIDMRRVVIQKNGILRSRPKITDWRCVLEFEYDEEMIDPGVILQIMQGSGKTPGVGDYRIGKKGPFGRYTVALGGQK